MVRHSRGLAAPKHSREASDMFTATACFVVWQGRVGMEVGLVIAKAPRANPEIPIPCHLSMQARPQRRGLGTSLRQTSTTQARPKTGTSPQLGLLKRDANGRGACRRLDCTQQRGNLWARCAACQDSGVAAAPETGVSNGNAWALTRCASRHLRLPLILDHADAD